MGDGAVLSSGSSATRHSCKVCRKGFPCGRSLGGHMRSHSLAEVETAVEDDADDNGEEQQQRRGSDCAMAPGAGGYGLRENPKKTRRLSGLDGGDESGGRQDGECGHGDRGELLWPRSPEAEAEREQEDALLMPAPRRRRRSMRVPAPAPPPAFDNEPEDVALCLIMLSRDILDRRDSTAMAAEYSPEKAKRKRRLEEYHHDADSDDTSALFQYTDIEIDTKINKRKPSRGLAGDEKRGRYECPGCGRAFQSYQALGGHRASHKRINSNCSIAKAAPDQPEPSVETNASSFSTASLDIDYAADITNNTAVVALKAKPPKAIKFECPICFKVFGSGQALGGHKRSHSIAGELYQQAHADGDDGIHELEQPTIADGFLDLNLPAPGVED